jgi:hypothetical protein
MEAEVLENIGDRRAAGLSPRPQNYSRRVVLIFVDDVDLATLSAIRYARSLRPTTLRAVHFVIDSARAQQLHADWIRFGQDIPLEMVDTPDRRLTRASLELVNREAHAKGTQVTVVLPRRGYSPLTARLLHDRTADKIAEVVSQVSNAAATIIPFDVETRVHLLHARHAARLAEQQADPGQGVATSTLPLTSPTPKTADPGAGEEHSPVRDNHGPAPAAAGTTAGNGSTGAPVGPGPGVIPIAAVAGGKATVEGKVRAVEIHPVENSCVFEAAVADGTGVLTAKFYGRTSIPGFEPGVRVRLSGQVSLLEDGPAMINPAYELLAKDG